MAKSDILTKMRSMTKRYKTLQIELESSDIKKGDGRAFRVWIWKCSKIEIEYREILKRFQQEKATSTRRDACTKMMKEHDQAESILTEILKREHNIDSGLFRMLLEFEILREEYEKNPVNNLYIRLANKHIYFSKAIFDRRTKLINDMADIMEGIRSYPSIGDIDSTAAERIVATLKNCIVRFGLELGYLEMAEQQGQNIDEIPFDLNKEYTVVDGDQFLRIKEYIRAAKDQQNLSNKGDCI